MSRRSGRPDKEITNVPGVSGSSYRELSSLVMKQDRSEVVRRDREAGSDAVESLWGKVNATDMGTRAGREAAPVASAASGVLGLSRGTGLKTNRFRGGEEEEGLAGLLYRPKTTETRAAYEHLLTFLQRMADFTDQPASVVRSAADDVLAVLKATEDSWKDLDRKERVTDILGLKSDDFTPDKYAQLANLARRLTDYPLNADAFEPAAKESQGLDVGGYLDDEGEAEDEEDGDLGLAANVLEDGEEELAEDEAEFEKSLPIARLLQGKPGGSKNDSIDQALLDIDALAFPEGGHTMTNKKCLLPEKSFKIAKKGYEEICVPAPEAAALAKDEKLLAIRDLPVWAQPAFAGMKTLNRVQSRLWQAALTTPDNLLLCAPTGAGKTNVALLTMLQEIGKHLEEDVEVGASVAVRLEDFKIVYIAPMKALVQEMVRNFSARLQPYGLKVAELTGDSSLTRAQLAATQVIVTTPEKWDVVTRKQSDASSFTRLVRLVIIDEIHLLHDERGPVLESLVTRTLRQAELTQEWVRLVGLSATLPNYLDVARFLRVDLKSGVFFFDGSFRPCPLEQRFVGITEKKPLKAIALMNEICYEKAAADVAARNQVLIFVHSRKETAKCAKAIRDLAIEAGTIGSFLPSTAIKQELETALEASRSADLKNLVPYGFAIHHAGMARGDRLLVEEAFASGHLQVLVSTATLAWGVNLPAHTVIIRGTRVYSPERGCWTELSAQDVLQMLGRAGRPQFDTVGCGVILTAHSELQYYLSLMNSQLPIESQLMRRLVDALNAEVVLGMVRSVDEAVTWLAYTFLYIRMVQEPQLYGVDLQTLDGDPKLSQFRRRLVHSAAVSLEKAGLVRYDRRSGQLQATDLGRVASYYYLTYQSMLVYGENLRSTMTEIDLFRVFCMSSEFRMIPIRAEEKMELAALAERAPIPIKELPTEDPLGKINILLQAYISQLPLEGFALVSDMVYVTQSANRLWRAILEICLRRGWARLAHKALDVCKMVQHRQWLSYSPLRQVSTVPIELVKRLERKDFPFERLFDLNPAELGELVRAPKQGKELYDHLQAFPRLGLAANILPLSHSLLRIEVAITPEFDWSEDAAGTETFWLTVEDVDQETVLYVDSFILRRARTVRGEAQLVTVNVPLLDPLPPLYFVRLTSDRLLHCQATLPISLMNMQIPAASGPSTALLDLPLLNPAVALGKHAGLGEAVFEGIDEFNAVQTQVFPALFRSDENVFVGASAAADLLTCAEVAVLRHLIVRPQSRVVYLCPVESVLKHVCERWTRKFESIAPKGVVLLTGEMAADMKLIESASLILALPHHWDLISRRWRQRRIVQTVGLLVADKLHFVGKSDVGPEYEVVLSRSRFISSQLEEASEGSQKIRIVALSEPLANAADVAEWLACPHVATFNFDVAARPTPLRVQLQSFPFEDSTGSNASLIAAMARPAFLSLVEGAERTPDGPVAIVYVEGRRAARNVAIDFLTLSSAESVRKVVQDADNKLPEDYSLFAGGSPHIDTFDEDMESALAALLPHGIGYYHESLSENVRRGLEERFAAGRVKVMVVSRACLWDCRLSAPLVVLAGTHFFEGRERRFVEYQVADIFEMLNHAQAEQGSGPANVLLLTTNPMKAFYRQVLYEPLPIESHLDQYLQDPFNAEIVSRVITNKQDAIDYVTWTFLYRRLALNPHYYGLSAVSSLAISEHLSMLVETALDSLQEAKCVRVVDDFGVEPLNLGMIAAYYSIHYATIEMMAVSLQPATRLRGILQVIAAAAEFDWLVPLRAGEEALLAALHAKCPVKLGAASLKLHDPHVKVALLLQCHFSRFELPGELKTDLETILARAVPLCCALIDVLSSLGWLAPALSAMQFCQMIVQGMWDGDSQLLQLPYFVQERAQEAAEQFSCESIPGFIDLGNKEKLALLRGLDSVRIAEVARAANDYPSDLEVSLLTGDKLTVSCGEEVSIRVELALDSGDSDGEADSGSGGTVSFARFPTPKQVAWWVVVGNPAERSLLAIKRLFISSNTRKVQTELDFSAPDQAANLSLKVYVLCDSWLGCDQELDLSLLIE